MTEYEQAKAWRVAKGLSLDDLADLTGYSRTSILWFERGALPSGKEINKFAWHRYKRICQAIDADLNPVLFGWGGSI
jgi:transcriptional regulator with XRE-family HTH domain